MKLPDKSCQDLHDNRVELGRTIGEEPEINTNTGWSCLDRNRKKMKYQIPGNDKSNSFITALDTMDAEIFSRWEDDDKFKYKCIVKNLKDDWRRDEKFFNAPLQLNVNVGDTVTWDRIGIRWLVTWQDYLYKDFFRGEIHKATHLIRWKNKNGNIKEQWASVKGPVETRAKYEQSAGVVENGRQNDHIEILIGANDKDNINSLSRFKKIKVLNRTWRIHVVDDITNEGIYRMSCVEDFNNEDQDDVLEMIPQGQVDFGKNEIEPSKEPEEVDNYCKIVGPKYIRKGIVTEFRAIDINENPIDGIFTATNATVEEGKTKSTCMVTGKKIGDKVNITFISDDGDKINSIEVTTVSILG